MSRVVLLDDVSELTARRFRRTSGVGGTRLPRVDRALLPPGPRWPVLVQSAALMRLRHWFHPYLARRYGDVFTVRLVPGGRALVLFTRPEHTREIFAADPEVFHAGRGNAILGPVMGKHSLLLQDSVEHQRARKLLMPAFNGVALREYRTLVTDLARAEVGTWREGTELRALDRMNALTLEVILRVVFGVSDEDRLARLRPCVKATVDVSPAILLGWGYPRLQRYGPWRRTVDNQYALDRLMYAEIRERRLAPDLAERTDVLSRLMRAGAEDGDPLDDTELRDQLVTLLLAGHETTATALSWALYEVGRDPGLRARTQAAAERDPGVRRRRPSLHRCRVLADGGRREHLSQDQGPHHHRRRRPPRRGDGRAVDHRQPPALRGVPRPRGVPARPLPRQQPPAAHLDPVRRRRPSLHRCRVLADGGRRGPARGVRGVRRRGPRLRRAESPQHHQRPAARRPHPDHVALTPNVAPVARGVGSRA
jgi:cytochrome P450